MQTQNDESLISDYTVWPSSIYGTQTSLSRGLYLFTFFLPKGKCRGPTQPRTEVYLGEEASLALLLPEAIGNTKVKGMQRTERKIKVKVR